MAQTYPLNISLVNECTMELKPDEKWWYLSLCVLKEQRAGVGFISPKEAFSALDTRGLSRKIKERAKLIVATLLATYPELSQSPLTGHVTPPTAPALLPPLPQAPKANYIDQARYSAGFVKEEFSQLISLWPSTLRTKGATKAYAIWLSQGEDEINTIHQAAKAYHATMDELRSLGQKQQVDFPSSWLEAQPWKNLEEYLRGFKEEISKLKQTKTKGHKAYTDDHRARQVHQELLGQPLGNGRMQLFIPTIETVGIMEEDDEL